MESDKKAKFTEIEVERINVVGGDGKPRLVLTNEDRLPAPVIDGQTVKRQGTPVPGILFFNHAGEECGGLVFGGDRENWAGAALMFDQRRNDQIIGLLYRENDGRREYGLRLWERPDLPPEYWEKAAAAHTLPEGPERDALLRETAQGGGAGVQRVFVGHSEAGEVKVTLADSKGRERIRMRIDADDVPRLEFLDEAGKVVYSLPPGQEK